MEKNAIIKELEYLASDVFSDKQRNYYLQMLKDAKVIEISPLSEVFDAETIALIKSAIDPKAKECYRNATLLCQMFPEFVKYVEGSYTVFRSYSTEHAWNRIGDKYVDITMEIALGKNPLDEDYVSYGEYTWDEVKPYLDKQQFYGDIYVNKYLENEKAKI